MQLQTEIGENLFQGYASNTYDEYLEPSGAIRPGYEFLIQSLGSMGINQLNERTETLRRILRENGVVYQVYNQDVGVERAWPLDPVPMVLPSKDWAKLERGLLQRAELLDALLRDIYHNRRIVKLIPPEIVYSHTGFIRSCVSLLPMNQRHLLYYAADLARNSDGSFYVLGDRSQAPSGSGYALENRIVLSQVFPSLYRDSNVHRIALFFRTLRNEMRSADPERTVLLTPGPGTETYFEHAYLADYLGFTLAQGRDLLVRSNRLFLRTLDGLKPVDTVLRRIDDLFCDPLELRGDSLLGVSGMLHAIRSGHLKMANPPGSAALENPAFAAFLPMLCKEYLGEELLLPSVETFWLGDDFSRSHVFSNIGDYVIRPISPNGITRSTFAAKLSDVQINELKKMVLETPYSYVAQRNMNLSTAPVWTGNRMEARPMVLRTFLTARDDAFVAMPGGLVRVGNDSQSNEVSNARGGLAKDLWILASEKTKQETLLIQTRSREVLRSSGEIPARVADNLYWLGRYMVRANCSVRTLREIHDRLTQPELYTETLSAIYGAAQYVMGYPLNYTEPTLEDIERIATDPQFSGGVIADTSALVRCAKSVRERLSEDSMRLIYTLDLRENHSLNEFFDRWIYDLAAFESLSKTGMSSGQGKRFFDAGANLEESIHLISLIFGILQSGQNNPSTFEAILTIKNSKSIYLRRYKAGYLTAFVLDLLLLDESNPNSLSSCLMRLERIVRSLPGKEGRRTEADKLIIEALANCQLLDVEQHDLNSIVRSLLQILSNLQSLNEEIVKQYFRTADIHQQLGVL